MFFEILVSPLHEEKDKKVIDYCEKHQNQGHVLFQGPEFSFSFHFTHGGGYPDWVNKTDTWFILWYFFATKDVTAKENVVQYEDMPTDVFDAHKKSVMKAALNWLKGKKAQRKIYHIFLEQFTHEKREDPKKDANTQMDLLRTLIAEKEGKTLIVKESFPASQESWNVYGCYAGAHHAHHKNKETPNATEYAEKMQRYFYLPLHAAILQSAHSERFQHLLTANHKSEGEQNLLQQMSLLLHGYHIERGGNKAEPCIGFTRHDLHLLGIPQKEIRPLLHDLAVLLKDVVIIDDMTDDEEYNPKVLPAVIRFYLAGLPEMSSSIQLKKLNREKV